MSLQQAQQQRDALYQAWDAAGRPRTGDLWDQAQAAVKALAEAKHAAEKNAAQQQDQLLAAAKQATADRAADRRKDAALNRARRLYDQAQEWPRCGQDWPVDSAEERADKLLRLNAAHYID